MQLLNELVELAKKATPGPWKMATDWERAAVYSLSKDAYPESKRVVCSGNQNNHKRWNAEPWSGADWIDAEFIAAANPAAILAIAEYVKSLESQIADAGKMIVPEGMAIVPIRLTAENGAKSALIGEFKEEHSISCPECFGDDDCETCDGSGRIDSEVTVSWTTIKDIWAKGIEHFTAPEAPHD